MNFYKKTKQSSDPRAASEKTFLHDLLNSVHLAHGTPYFKDAVDDGIRECEMQILCFQSAIKHIADKPASAIIDRDRHKILALLYMLDGRQDDARGIVTRYLDFQSNSKLNSDWVLLADRLGLAGHMNVRCAAEEVTAKRALTPNIYFRRLLGWQAKRQESAPDAIPAHAVKPSPHDDAGNDAGHAVADDEGLRTFLKRSALPTRFVAQP